MTRTSGTVINPLPKQLRTTASKSGFRNGAVSHLVVPPPLPRVVRGNAHLARRLFDRVSDEKRTRLGCGFPFSSLRVPPLVEADVVAPRENSPHRSHKQGIAARRRLLRANAPISLNILFAGITTENIYFSPLQPPNLCHGFCRSVTFPTTPLRSTRLRPSDTPPHISALRSPRPPAAAPASASFRGTPPAPFPSQVFFGSRTAL